MEITGLDKFWSGINRSHNSVQKFLQSTLHTSRQYNAYWKWINEDEGDEKEKGEEIAWRNENKEKSIF